jgi:hypothetical protein
MQKVFTVSWLLVVAKKDAFLVHLKKAKRPKVHHLLIHINQFEWFRSLASIEALETLAKCIEDLISSHRKKKER